MAARAQALPRSERSNQSRIYVDMLPEKNKIGLPLVPDLI